MTRWYAILAAVVALVSCAGPPVTLYTLGVPSGLPSGPPSGLGAEAPLGLRPVVIAIARVTLPDHLDTRDIMVRHGAVLESSHTGRWAGRLSLGITELLTGRLGLRRPDALVTDQPQTSAPSYRLLINVSRLDLAAGDGRARGTATLEADWQIIPRDPAIAASRDRTRIDVVGAMATDGDVVALTTSILDRLAARIDLTRLR